MHVETFHHDLRKGNDNSSIIEIIMDVNRAPLLHRWAGMIGAQKHRQYGSTGWPSAARGNRPAPSVFHRDHGLGADRARDLYARRSDRALQSIRAERPEPSDAIMSGPIPFIRTRRLQTA